MFGYEIDLQEKIDRLKRKIKKLQKEIKILKKGNNK